MSSGRKFIPQGDADLQAWLVNFAAVLNGNPAAAGLVAADLTPLTVAQTGFNAAVTDQIAKREAADAAVQTKKTRRTTLEQTLRPLVRRIQAHPATTDALRAGLGVTVPDRTPTRRNVGGEVPALVLELKPGQVVVRFGTSPGDEQKNGKPDWAAGCNIYRKRASDAAFALIAFDTSSPYVDSVTGAAANYSYKVAYRGVRDTDEGAYCPEQTVAAGG